MLRPLILILAVLTLPACSLITGMKEPVLLHDQHPLVDRIWDVAAQRFVSREELLAAARRSRYLLLGETHDNPLHHRHQAEIIASLGERRATILFEMIDDDQAQLLADTRPQSAGELIDTLNRVSNAWQYDPLYVPVFNSAIAAGHAMGPGSLSREVILDIMRQNDRAIPQAVREVMTRTPLAAEQRASLEREIGNAHCGMLHGGMAAGMVRAQRAKDATMALRMSGRDDARFRVLVAGSGHTRKDRGVPLYLDTEGAGSRALSISWVEVLPDKTAAGDYARQWDSPRLPFDYVWFTPRLEREDPCIAMRAHFRKSR